MPFDPAFAGLVATGIDKIVDTKIGELCIHHAHRIADPREKRRGSGSRARSVDSRNNRRDDRREERKRRDSAHSDREWSKKSYYQGSRHQQKSKTEFTRAQDPGFEDDWSRRSYLRRQQQEYYQRPPPPPLAEPQPYYMGERSSKEARRASLAHEQRCDQFRDAKSRYVPVASPPPATEMKWNEQQVYADVGRAVREAARRGSCSN